jgi:hypothetical protein
LLCGLTEALAHGAIATFVVFVSFWQWLQKIQKVAFVAVLRQLGHGFAFWPDHRTDNGNIQLRRTL